MNNMAIAEYYFDSILIEGKGVHVLTWEEKGDLVRALIIMVALFNGKQIYSLLLTSAESVELELGSLFSIKPIAKNEYNDFINQAKLQRDSFLLLFLDQAVGSSIGPL